MKTDDQVAVEINGAQLTRLDLLNARDALLAKAGKTRALIIAKGASLPENPNARVLRDAQAIIQKLEEKAARMDAIADRFDKAYIASLARGGVVKRESMTDVMDRIEGKA